MTASGKLLLLKLLFALNKHVTSRLCRQKIRLKSDPKMKEWKFVLSEL